MPVNQPLVTVFTLIYNTNPRFVIEAIESIRANNYPNIQHIIIDDCSPNPEPKRVVKEWIDREKYLCEFYEHEVNYGVCKTLNHVLELAKGIYIFGCSDDIISRHKIISEVEVLNELDESYAATYSDAFLIDEKSELTNEMFIKKFSGIDNPPDENILTELCKSNFLPMMSMMFKTEYIKKIGGFDEELEYEDYDLHLRIFKKYKIRFINTPMSYYRIHGESLVHNIQDLSKNHFLIFSKHLEIKECRLKVQSIKIQILNSTNELNQLKFYKIKNAIFWSIFSKFLSFSKIRKKSNFFNVLNKLNLVKW